MQPRWLPPLDARLDAGLVLTGFVAFLLVAIFFDATRRKAPNAMVVAGALGALAALALNLNPVELTAARAALGGLLALALLLPFYGLGSMAAGDVKLGAVLGLWLGPQLMLATWLGANLLALLHALLVLSLSARRRRAPMPPPGPTGARSTGRKIPLAAYMSIVALAFTLWRHLPVPP